MPDPIPGEVLERGLMYAMALGVVRTFAASKADAGGYRRFRVLTSDGEWHQWTAGAVDAFVIGVRLATERGEQ